MGSSKPSPLLSGDNELSSIRGTRANKRRPANINTSVSGYALFSGNDGNCCAEAIGHDSGISSVQGKHLSMYLPYTPTSPGSGSHMSPPQTAKQSMIQNFFACKSPGCSPHGVLPSPKSPTSPHPAQSSYTPSHFAPIHPPQNATTTTGNPYPYHPFPAQHPFSSTCRGLNDQDGKTSLISFNQISCHRDPSQLPSPISPPGHARPPFHSFPPPKILGPHNLIIPSFEKLQKKREDLKRKDTFHMPQQNVQGNPPVFRSKLGSTEKNYHHDDRKHNHPEEKLTVSTKHLTNHMLNPEFARRYVIGDELGSGGFGFVVSAQRTLDGREVAVKFIHKDKVPVHGWIQDARSGYIPMEIYVIKNFSHPGMIAYLDMYDDYKFFYLVMELHGTPWTSSNTLLQSATSPPAGSELVKNSSFRGGGLVGAAFEGTRAMSDHLAPKINPSRPEIARRTSCDLFECIEHHSKFSENKARYIFKQIVDCVGFLNEYGICHRDIKDENIVIDKDLKVKLVDFGSAVIVQPTGQLFDRFYGTINYASPEILRGEKYRAESAEIWSLGILLYTLLYGEVPFNDPQQAIYGPYVSPRIQSSRECTHLLNWMLEKKGNLRASIEDVCCHPWLHTAKP